MLLIMLQLLLRKFSEKDFFRPRQKLVSGQIDKQSDDDDKSNGMKIKQIRFYGESFQTKSSSVRILLRQLAAMNFQGSYRSDSWDCRKAIEA